MSKKKHFAQGFNAQEYIERMTDSVIGSGRSPSLGEIAGPADGKGLRLLPNPDIVLRKAGVSTAIYEEILTDPNVAGAIGRRKAGTLRQRWWLNPESASGPGLEESTAWWDRFVTRQVIDVMLNAASHGAQPMEVIWGEQDGLSLPRRLADRANEHFAYSESGNLLYRPRVGKTTVVRRFDDGEPEPGEVSRKFLLPRHGATAKNPYGRALLSLCFWPVSLKRGGVEFYSNLIERYGTPYLMIEDLDLSGTDEEQAAELTTLMAQWNAMVQGGIIALKGGAKGRIDSSGASAAAADLYLQFLQFHNQEASKGILGHAAGLDSTPGKLGGEDTAEEAIADHIEADTAMLQAELQTLLEWVYYFNWPDSLPPTVEAYHVGDINMPKAQLYALLSQQLGVEFTDEHIATTFSLPAGSFKRRIVDDGGLLGTIGGSAQVAELQKLFYGPQLPREAAINNLRTVFKMPQEDAQGLFVEIPPNAPTTPLLPAAAGALAAGPAFAAAAGDDHAPRPEQQLIDQLLANIDPTELHAKMKTVIGPITEFVQGKADYSEAIAGLGALYPEMDTTALEHELAKLILRSMTTGQESVNAGNLT